MPQGSVTDPCQREDGIKILLVEDDPLVRQHVFRLLTGLGHETICAHDAPTALQHLAEIEGIDLLFTDIVMPGGMDGVELAERARTVRNDIRVLLTSGYADADILRNRSHVPGAQLLSKPYRLKQLRDKLEALFGCSEARPKSGA